MRLKRVVVENVCQFRMLDHTFHPGLTGIIGPNGSGKSNLTKAIFFALTGVFRNAGVKADNVNQIPQGKRSGVVLWLEHEGIEMTVQRGLANVKTKLQIQGEADEIIGDNAVTEALMEILGVDVKLLGEYVFILQLHMTDFIEATPGDRAKVFQRLFGTDECEAVQKFAATVLDKELAVTEQADLAAIRARLEANGGRMEALISRLEKLDGEVATHEAKEKAARRLVADAEWADANTRELGLLTQRMARTHEEWQAYAQSRDQAVSELVAMEEALLHVSGDAEQARIKLATWKTVEQRRARARTLAKRRERLEGERAKNVRPAEVRDVTDEEKAELKELWARHVRLENQLELAQSGKAECPTCGQPVAGIGTPDAIIEEVAEVDRRIDALESIKTAHGIYLNAVDRWNQWYDQHAQAMADLVAEEHDLDDEVELGPEIDPEALQGTVDEEKELKDAIAKLRRRGEGAGTEAARLKGAWDQMHARHQELVAEGKKRAVSPDALRDARAVLATLDSLRSERERAEGEADELGRTLDADEALLVRMQELEASNAVTRVLRDGLGQVVDVTHRNAAPRLVSEAHLDRLIDDVDEHLEMFGSDFLVRLGPGLSFVADFPDGRAQAGGRLSEGQKAVLALAFWVAVNSLFARQIGFLSLDEPTSSLDQQNIGAVEVALSRLRELSESLGLQCLLVTHEPALAPLFDSVLQL